MDELDIQLIQLLKMNARISISEIAKQTNRRRSTIHDRITKLEKQNTIKGYTVVPNFDHLKAGTTVFILASVLQSTYENIDDPEMVGDQISKIPYVTEVYNVTGQWDFLIKAHVPDLETMGRQITFNLQKSCGIGQTLTLAAFSTIKEELSMVPFNFL
ncbi:MAG: Lrp/AsnC family transcriptional regulator [Candidatus Kariarchaeaceae archaeon]|jgi:DNA-binding Lrp family transcriptional regulator